jgi:hypothetical protein
MWDIGADENGKVMSKIQGTVKLRGDVKFRGSPDYKPAMAHIFFGTGDTFATVSKVCIFQASGTLIACSDPITINRGNTASASISASSLAPGDYLLGVIGDAYVPLALTGYDYTDQIDYTNSYASPQSVSPGTDGGTANGDVAIWITNSAGVVLVGDNNTSNKTLQATNDNGMDYWSFTRISL